MPAIFYCIIAEVENKPTIKTLHDAEEYLNQFLSSKWTYTLGRMNQLVALLGHPERKIPIIHIGGTAGKGSTSYIAASILEKAGYKIGLHMSPHMISITERLMINRSPIPEEKFVKLLHDIIPAINEVSKSNPDGAPTYYEITVAMMFKYFADEKVDAAVIEVGLGGKLDGTNVLTPVVSVVNNVGLDHTEILGDTVEKIAKDKREIIKAGHPAVSGVTQPTVKKIIIEKCKELKTPLYLLERDFFVKNIRPLVFKSVPTGKHDAPITFDYVSDEITLKNLKLSLFGRHQATNAAVAITAVLHSGLKVTEPAIRSAIFSIDYIGRLEIATIHNAPVLIDGAHNPMKMAALSQALTDHFPAIQFPALLAVKKDKKVKEMISILAPHVSHWYATTLERQTDWGKRVMYDIPQLVEVIKKVDGNKQVTAVPKFPEFLSNLNTKEPLLITGSLYLVGAVEEWKKR